MEIDSKEDSSCSAESRSSDNEEDMEDYLSAEEGTVTTYRQFKRQGVIQEDIQNFSSSSDDCAMMNANLKIDDDEMTSRTSLEAQTEPTTAASDSVPYNPVMSNRSYPFAARRADFGRRYGSSFSGSLRNSMRQQIGASMDTGSEARLSATNQNNKRRGHSLNVDDTSPSNDTSVKRQKGNPDSSARGDGHR